MSKIYYAEFAKSTVPVFVKSPKISNYCLASSKKKISDEFEITPILDLIFDSPHITRDIRLINDDMETFTSVSIVNTWFLRVALEPLVSTTCPNDDVDRLLRFLETNTDLLILNMRSKIHDDSSTKSNSGIVTSIVYEK